MRLNFKQNKIYHYLWRKTVNVSLPLDIQAFPLLSVERFIYFKQNLLKAMLFDGLEIET